jgi:hypothetical protein
VFRVVAPPRPAGADCGMRPVLRWSVAAALAVTPLLATCNYACGCSPPVDTFESNLLGENVVPPVTTTASGSARFKLLGDYRLMRYELSVANLTGPVTAKVHVGNAGANGSARVTLCDPCATSGSIVLTTDTVAVDAQLVTSMRAFGTYLEITTAAGRVLRGQLRVVAE